MKPDYSFQDGLVRKAQNNLEEHGLFVLAAAPGAGKTRMALRVIRRMQKEGKIRQALVLCHGQSILRKQWREVATDLGFDVQELSPRTKEVDSDTDVILALPHALARYGYDSFAKCDLVVVDEAHHFLEAGMITKFFAESLPKFRLLLTGTPGRLISRGLLADGITLSEMIDYGVASNPKVHLWLNGYDHQLSDLNENLVINRFEDKDTIKSLELISSQAKQEGVTITKRTMVACQSIHQARVAWQWFLKNEIKACLCVSIDPEAEEDLDAFISGGYDVAVVVNRGIVGFDYPELETIIDLSCTFNIDKIFQLLCRLIRPARARKNFIKVCGNNLTIMAHYVLSYVAAMAIPEYYYEASDRYKELEIPVKNEFIKVLGAAKNDPRGRTIKISDLPPLSTFEEIREGVRKGLYARTTFNFVKQALGGKNNDRSLEDTIIEAQRYSHPTFFRRADVTSYKWLRKAMKSLDDFYMVWGLRYNKNLPTKWTKETARAHFLKMLQFTNNRHDLKKQNNSLYKYLHREDKAFLNKHLKSTHRMTKWTVEEAVKESQKYQAWNNFRVRSNGAFMFLKRKHPKVYDELRAKICKKNPSSTVPKVFEIRGKKYTTKEIREKWGIGSITFRKRLAYGWDIERAATEPSHASGN